MPDRRTFEFRRSERLPMTIPIRVSGTQKGASFRETANTLNVCAHGALISVANPLEERQGVLVTNLKTLKEIQGEVVWVKPIAGGRRSAFNLQSLLPTSGTSPLRRNIEMERTGSSLRTGTNEVARHYTIRAIPVVFRILDAGKSNRLASNENKSPPSTASYAVEVKATDSER